MKGNPGVNRLARTLQSRMTEIGTSQPVMELGTIMSDGSLVTDRFPVPIPAGEYMVCRNLTSSIPLVKISIGSAMVGEHGAHQHTATVSSPTVQDQLNEKMLVKSGDRVLVIWVNNGVDPVVMDVVMSS